MKPWHEVENEKNIEAVKLAAPKVDVRIYGRRDDLGVYSEYLCTVTANGSAWVKAFQMGDTRKAYPTESIAMVALPGIELTESTARQVEKFFMVCSQVGRRDAQLEIRKALGL